MIPESFVKEGLSIAHEMTLFGRPFEELTREELIAAAAQGWAAERRARERDVSKAKLMSYILCNKA